MIKLIIFILLTVFFIIISRKSLLKPLSHGFYRFFAWEIITALLLLNINHWFGYIYSWNQITSWLLLIGSLVPLFAGIKSLKMHGRAVSQRNSEPQLYDFEKTSSLVTNGIYRYIRHPLYSSLLLLTWGIFFKNPQGAGLQLALAATLFLIATAKADEKECIEFFGKDYIEYMKTTRMFFPYLA